MKKKIIKINIVTALLILAVTALLSSCANNSGNSANLQLKIDSLQNELKKFTDEKALTDEACTI